MNIVVNIIVIVIVRHSHHVVMVVIIFMCVSFVIVIERAPFVSLTVCVANTLLVSF